MTRRGTPIEAAPVKSYYFHGDDSASSTAGAVATVVPAVTASRGSSTVSIDDYSVWAAVGDVERYQKLCNFSVALSSVINPGPSFAETAAGITARLAALRTQLALNRAEINAATGTHQHQQRQTLEMVNSNIATRILVLQQRLLTAPLTMEAKPAGGNG